MRRLIPLTTGLIVLIASGFVHGRFTDRWGQSDATRQAALKLEHIPLTFGPWRGERLAIRDPNDLAGVAGYFYARYVNSRDHQAVQALLVCGRPGIISIHTPDACYSAAGYDVLSQVRVPVSRARILNGDEFWSADMLKKRAAEQSRLRILWAWSAGGRWSIPDSPRLTFAQYPVLYKLYVLKEAPAVGETSVDDSISRLLDQLLPELQKVFNAPS